MNDYQAKTRRANLTLIYTVPKSPADILKGFEEVQRYAQPWTKGLGFYPQINCQIVRLYESLGGTEEFLFENAWVKPAMPIKEYYQTQRLWLYALRMHPMIAGW